MDTSKLFKTLLSSVLVVGANAWAAPDLSIGKNQDNRQAKNGTSRDLREGLRDNSSARTKNSLGLKGSENRSGLKENLNSSGKSDDQKSLKEGPIATGGGAVVRTKKGETKTLVEAGYVFEQAQKLVAETQYQAFYIIKPETKEALKKLLAELPPIREGLYNSILEGGDRSVFIEQTKVDEEIYKNIQKDYASVVKSFQQKLDPSMFILAAYSTAGKTYILPAFEKDLNPDQQAQILVHEYFMRMELSYTESTIRDLFIFGSTERINSYRREKAQESLKSVLETDYMIYKFRTSAKTVVDQIDFYTTADKKYAFDFTNDKFVNSYFKTLNNTEMPKIIHQLESKLDRPLLVSDLFLNAHKLPYVIPTLTSPEHVTPGLVVRFNSLVPGIVEKLKNLNLGIVELNKIGQFITDLKYKYERGERIIDSFIYSDAPAGQSEMIARGQAIAQEQCSQNSGYLAKSDQAHDALLHSDLELGRVLVIRCNYENTGKILIEVMLVH